MDTGSVVPDILSPSCAALQLQGAVLGQLDKVLIPSEPAPVALVLQSPMQWWTPEGSGCDMLRNKVSTYIHVAAKVQIASQKKRRCLQSDVHVASPPSRAADCGLN